MHHALLVGSPSAAKRAGCLEWAAQKRWHVHAAGRARPGEQLGVHACMQGSAEKLSSTVQTPGGGGGHFHYYPLPCVPMSTALGQSTNVPGISCWHSPTALLAVAMQDEVQASVRHSIPKVAHAMGGAWHWEEPHCWSCLLLCAPPLSSLPFRRTSPQGHSGGSMHTAMHFASESLNDQDPTGPLCLQPTPHMYAYMEAHVSQVRHLPAARWHAGSQHQPAACGQRAPDQV